MILRKLFPLLAVLLLSGCVEKNLQPGNGEVRISYDWSQLPQGNTRPDGMVAWFYPDNGTGVPFSIEGERLGQPLALPRGSYRVLLFNKDVSGMNFTDLTDFERACISLQPLGTRSDAVFPSVGWLYGGALLALRVDGSGVLEQTVVMRPYVRRVKVVIQTDVTMVDASYGILGNTAVGVLLKDGCPAPLGNGTTRFEFHKTTNGLQADFTVFGVDSTAGGDLKNEMTVVVEDKTGNRNDLKIDVSDILAGNNNDGSSQVENELTGIGKVTVIVDDWGTDDEDNSLTETPIRLSASVGMPVRSVFRKFKGEYGVTVEKVGGSVPLYMNNQVVVEENGQSVVGEQMYYPLGKVNIYAYAPYAAIPPVTWQVTGDTLIDDLLWAKVDGQEETDAEVALNFGHLLSALRVELTCGINIPESDFQAAKVYVRNMVTTADVDLTRGFVTKQADADVTELQLRTSIGDDGKIRASTLIVPQTFNAGQVLLYVVVREDLVFTYKPGTELLFNPGKRQTILLTLEDVTAFPESVLTKSSGIDVRAMVREEKF